MIYMKAKTPSQPSSPRTATGHFAHRDLPPEMPLLGAELKMRSMAWKENGRNAAQFHDYPEVVQLRDHSIRLRDHPNLMQGWESVCWLVIGITLPENRKVGSFLGKNNSCFLIETKFIFKISEKFRRENWCHEIPRLRLFIIFKNSSFLIIKNSGIKNFKNSKSGHFTIFKNKDDYFPITLDRRVILVFLADVLCISKKPQHQLPPLHPTKAFECRGGNRMPLNASGAEIGCRGGNRYVDWW